MSESFNFLSNLGIPRYRHKQSLQGQVIGIVDLQGSRKSVEGDGWDISATCSNQRQWGVDTKDLQLLFWDFQKVATMRTQTGIYVKYHYLIESK